MNRSEDFVGIENADADMETSREQSRS